jgi:radical SAM enzyme (TIGR01210 family)
VLSDRQIVDLRGPKARLDPARAYATVWEEEPDASGALVPTAVVFLTNRECPFRCVMCDLWVNTLDETVPRGAIAAQIRRALETLPAASQIKLYNAGSFFDPGAIPSEDDEEIAEAVAGFERVIVESHPAFLAGAWSERCLRFRGRLRGRLEVAVGLETANADVLARLNKRMTLDSFREAAAFLRANDIDLRVFILLNPPFLTGSAAIEWACRSIDVAVECGASVCSVIPTRSGNGAVEALGDAYQPPALDALERVVEYGISLGRCRVFADLWNVASPRLLKMNRTQRV